jgi:hypothetical protein
MSNRPSIFVLDNEPLTDSNEGNSAGSLCVLLVSSYPADIGTFLQVDQLEFTSITIFGCCAIHHIGLIFLLKPHLLDYFWIGNFDGDRESGTVHLEIQSYFSCWSIIVLLPFFFTLDYSDC